MGFIRNAARIWSGLGDRISLGCCLLMICGLFFSRAMLSVSMIVLFINALRPQQWRYSWKLWKDSRFAWCCALFFFSYFISGLWSGNKDFWLAGTINKLPFLVLPYALLSVPLYRYRYRRTLVVALMLMQLAIVAYSLSRLAMAPSYYIQGYSFSHPLPTTKYGDHIRFSLSLVASMLMAVHLLRGRGEERPGSKLKTFLYGGIMVFVVYVHILAAKTGLVCLYAGGAIYACAVLWQKSRWLAAAAVAAIMLLPLIAYRAVPTFRVKADYVLYEITKSREEQRFDYTLSDAGRMITYDLGLRAIARDPFTGVGAGDVMDVMREGYRDRYPEVAEHERYGPINQFLFTALCVGIPLTFFLVAMVLSPLGRRRPLFLFELITATIMLISMMVEAMLELQFGVFTYLFFTLFWISASGGAKRSRDRFPPNFIHDETIPAV